MAVEEGGVAWKGGTERHHHRPLQGFDFSGMSTLQEIKTAVGKLSQDELAMFRAWFEEFDAEVEDTLALAKLQETMGFASTVLASAAEDVWNDL